MDAPETHSVGLVKTFYTELFNETPLQLDSGKTLSPVQVAYETYGELNAEKTNALLICHALSGNAHAAGRHSPADKHPGWWDAYIGPGRPFDTDKYHIICANILGGCDGTTGPSSINPKTGKPWGFDFPIITVNDMVKVQKALIDWMEIPRLMAVVGGSMGGMQALEWVLDYPDAAGAAVIIAATTKLTAQNIAFNAVARQAIMRDPDFNGGDYYDGPPPKNGLSLARMMAHITYMSEQGLHEKFGRRLQDRDRLSYGFETDFAIESYLDYQGFAFVDRFDANTYLYITKAMDYFDPFPDAAAAAKRLEGVDAKFLVMSFDSDWRFDTSRSKELVKLLHWHQKDVTFQEFRSSHGHDAFLLNEPLYIKSLSGFLSRRHKELTGEVNGNGR